MKFPFQLNRQPRVATLPLSPLKFKPIRLADMPLINSMVQSSPSRTCDYTVGGIYMWIEWFKYEYCVVDDTLFIMGRTENRPDETAFSLPVGTLPLERSVQMILDYCSFKGLTPVFSAVPEDRLDALLDILGPSSTVEGLEDWSDYLYDLGSLASMSGKHLMKKRNHVNRFFAENPHWRFEALTHELLPETLLFMSGTRPDDAISGYEHDECVKVLGNLSSYPFEGAVLRGESGEIVAFAVGEVIGDTVFVHIEKINHEINGAGAAIVKLFSAYMQRRHPRLRYANREEDCGDPGLRAAKMSYHPAAMLNKFNVRPA